MTGPNRLIPGSIFEHYKGKQYRIHGVVRHSETLGEMVLYEALYQNDLGQLWVRPKEMFLEEVTVDGHIRPRFKFLK